MRDKPEAPGRDSFAILARSASEGYSLVLRASSEIVLIRNLNPRGLEARLGPLAKLGRNLLDHPFAFGRAGILEAFQRRLLLLGRHLEPARSALRLAALRLAALRRPLLRVGPRLDRRRGVLHHLGWLEVRTLAFFLAGRPRAFPLAFQPFLDRKSVV